MEVLYSTAIRRAELIALRLWDIDHERGTVFVRQGKGGRDRYAPIGPRALSWVDRYSELVRPRLVVKETDTLFLSASGGPLEDVPSPVELRWRPGDVQAASSLL